MSDFSDWFFSNKAFYGHAGRPGMVGGSVPSSQAMSRSTGAAAVARMRGKPGSRISAANPDASAEPLKAASNYVPGRKLTADEITTVLKPYESGDRQMFKYSDGDRVLSDFSQILGFDGLPQEMNRADYEAAVKAGDLIGVYRGVNAPKIETVKGYVEQYKSGEVYYGKGMVGNGIYSADNKMVAESYAWKSYGDEAIIEIGIRKDANIVSYDAIKNIPTHDKKHLNDLGDLGRMAMALGFDAMKIEMGDYFGVKTNYYVIYNRTATVVIRD